jgi:hypothetical protein
MLASARHLPLVRNYSGRASKTEVRWIADAHRDDGKRFVVHADELLTAFLELETVAGGSLRFPNSE